VLAGTGIVDPAALELLIGTYQMKIGPRNVFPAGMASGSTTPSARRSVHPAQRIATTP
jgi:hypothetical protein